MRIIDDMAALDREVRALERAEAADERALRLFLVRKDWDTHVRMLRNLRETRRALHAKRTERARYMRAAIQTTPPGADR